MNKYISIKETIKNNKPVYVIKALALEQKDKGLVKKIPHPFGNSILEFDSLEDAKKAIEIAGFLAILPSGTKVIEKNADIPSSEYGEMIYSSLMNLINDNNANIVANTISALSEVENLDCIKIFIEKMGEDNENIRNNAIEALVKYGEIAVKDIINALDDTNWIRKNSAAICLQKFYEEGIVTVDDIIYPLLKTLEDNNPIVKCSVISALGQIYKNTKSI